MPAVRTGFTEQHLFITITEDGGGFTAGHREGRGFENMHRRAQALGAKLAITPSAMGTALTCISPVPFEGSSTTFGLRRVT